MTFEDNNDNVYNEVNKFRFDIKQTMAELNKYLIYLNQYKLTSIINRRNQQSTNQYEINSIEVVCDEESLRANKKPIKIKKLKLTNPQKLQCEFCTRGFFSLQSYKEHLRCKHQKVTKFHCPTCGYSGGRPRRIATHLLEKHRTVDSAQQLIYFCPFTELTFTNLEELTNHICSETRYLSIGSKLGEGQKEQTNTEEQASMQEEIAVKLNASDQEDIQ